MSPREHTNNRQHLQVDSGAMNSSFFEIYFYMIKKRVIQSGKIPKKFLLSSLISLSVQGFVSTIGSCIHAGGLKACVMGMDKTNVREMDWWETVDTGNGSELICLPALDLIRHIRSQGLDPSMFVIMDIGQIFMQFAPPKACLRLTFLTILHIFGHLSWV